MTIRICKLITDHFMLSCSLIIIILYRLCTPCNQLSSHIGRDYQRLEINNTGVNDVIKAHSMETLTIKLTDATIANKLFHSICCK